MQALYDVPAPAKLNLFLHVVGKRPDGYHLLQSLFTLVDWADTLHFEKRSDGLLQRHDQGDALPPDDLCLRAARLLQQHGACPLGADIHIEKRLPSGAGMGGGSSDAASTLLALNRLWGLDLPRQQLLALGLQLGADVPFFIGGSPAFVEGIGEILTPVTLPSRRFAIVKPSASIPTAKIFSSPMLQRSESMVIVEGFAGNESLQLSKTTQFAQIGFGRNDLQKAAEAECVEVSKALAALEARFGNSRMTGSGSAVFAELSETITARIQVGVSNQPKATLEDLPPGWVGKICRSLELHPLRDWARD
ncbi:MAG: 4-(cytidine 5'-diphospho)-2-C-methyl-D-erythritol kinase [Burkholderiaceae bacterium]|nr:4-(cytidine 5'-diphospho)-2-C-methyl-D-erythritol kinase [Roseateles sp.]MBV8469085.1 4-(cytidine 5'-diphospho)-2-C-methyl-D-erythritol kinase [Burkholderiaceae bacterium]